MTIRQLAKELGLSKSTVAYALRDAPEVSAATRHLVQTRAKALGYIPNPVASAFLRQVRSGNAGNYRANLMFLIPKSRDAKDPLANREGSLQKSLFEGARERAEELGYGLDHVPTDADETKLTRLLLARGVLGVIVGPLSRAAGHIPLDWSKFAAVAYGFSMVRPVVHRLAHHHLHGVRSVVLKCRRKRFRRIGLAISIDSDMRSNRQWSAGFLGMQQTLSKVQKVPPFLPRLDDYTPARICTWIAKEEPDVVIVQAAGTVIGLREMMKQRSLEVPIVVLDRKPGDEHAGIDQNFTLSGRLLADALSQQILHNQRGIPETPIVSLVNGLWVDHPSLMPTGTDRGRPERAQGKALKSQTSRVNPTRSRKTA